MEYVLILGGPINGVEPSELLYERIKKGAQFLKERPEAKAIVSGGIKSETQKLSEAQIMKNSMLSLGIESERIILEDKAKTTYENFMFSKELLPKNAKIYFVTNKFHIWRSKKIMKKANVEYIPLPAPNGEDSLSFRIRECFLRPLAFFGLIW